MTRIPVEGSPMEYSPDSVSRQKLAKLQQRQQQRQQQQQQLKRG